MKVSDNEQKMEKVQFQIQGQDGSGRREKL
jgi:hypothetical protein